MKIGIIGTGMIASSVVTGFCKQKSGHNFFLSPRSADKAAALAAQFSEVKVCSSNQEVLDNADWIFISLHKKDFDAINELKFKKEHKVANMSAEMRLPDLKDRIGETALLAHVIPLPMIVYGYGPLLVYPKIKEVGDLFDKVSDVYYAEDPKDVHTLQIVTGMMSAYYTLMDEFVKFSDEQGIEHDLSVGFLHSLLSSLSRRATDTPNCDLIELAHDMTPGGYNEQAMTELLENGAIAAWRTALDRLLARLQGSSKQ
ncbi:MAG: NAD(P)-binding domain-containing protein [Defluviitaleaceae bacterium]|nr:NAD(P)-binding domain-containing protein [Defluviitaleaceae bacterium]